MNFLNRLVIGAVLFYLSGIIASCYCPNKYHPKWDSPAIPLARVPNKIRIALVLGGGGVKGIAHVGVLEEFERANIPIDLIVGCSAGSIVGALYADCPNAAWVRSVVEPLRTDKVLDIDWFHCRFGLSQGQMLRRVLECNLNARRFEELQIPLLTVSTDLCTSELVTFGGDEIIPAVRASSALPFVFAPVEWQGRILVDGGVVDPVPVRVAKDFGADLIIAVDLRGLLQKTFPRNLFGIAKRSAEITLLWQSEGCIADADVVVFPELGSIGTFDDSCNEQIYQAGRVAARAAIPKIQLLMAKLPHEACQPRHYEWIEPPTYRPCDLNRILCPDTDELFVNE